ncbi:hypothetical protein BSCG_02162 [Bacteroides sp. 2_2_4]|nr:hypothetical protein BSCG_02162 [Bacteroides sp. 2_2_4]
MIHKIIFILLNFPIYRVFTESSLNQYKKYGPANPLHYISMPKPRIQWGH